MILKKHEYYKSVEEYIEDKQYKKAINKIHIQYVQPNTDRNICGLLLGYCYYMNEDWKKAIQYLNRSSFIGKLEKDRKKYKSLAVKKLAKQKKENKDNIKKNQIEIKM